MEQENNFNILKNGVGHLMILIHARMSGVSKPYLIYDGGQKACLYRSEKNPVLLNYIHPAIRADLKKQKGVLVVEANDGAIVREYRSSVQVVESMPPMQ